MSEESMIERVAQAIEVAARASIPWPDHDQYYIGPDGEDEYRPSTLEEFVNNTYIGEKGADEVFKAAAEAGARAAIEAMREPTDGMVEAALDLGPDRAGETYYAAMIDKALT